MQKIILLLFVLLVSFQNKETKEYYTFNSINLSDLKPIMKKDKKSNWYGKAVLYRNVLRKIVFYDNDNRLIRKDSVMYANNVQYFVNVSNIEVYKQIAEYKQKVKLYKVTYTINGKMHKHYLIQRFKSVYPVAIQNQENARTFNCYKINTYSYSLKFKNIFDYLVNIKKMSDKKYYYEDYSTKELYYKNNNLYSDDTEINEWGKTKHLLPLIYKKNYGNLYLDMDKAQNFNYLIGPYYIERIKE